MVCFLEKGIANIYTSVFLNKIPSQYMNDQRRINLRANIILSMRKKILNSFDVKCVIPQINVWIRMKFKEPCDTFTMVDNNNLKTNLRVNNA